PRGSAAGARPSGGQARGSWSTLVATSLLSARARATISSAPSDGPPMRSTASQRATSRREIGWKISSNTSSPTRLLPASSTSGSASASPVTGVWPARNTSSATRFIVSTLAASFSGSSPVPDRYGPATSTNSDCMFVHVTACSCTQRPEMMPPMTDYVIVGAGSAGCVLAARLSEDSSARVLLIEAGGKAKHPNVSIPAAFAKQFKTKLDWDYSTEPEPGCANRSLYIPRGKGLGGSSSMNAMLYVRGRPLDYDAWEAQGAPGWGYRDVLPYFIRSEDNVRGASDWHGAGGPLRVGEQRSPRPLDRRLIAASEAAGIPWIADYNGPEQDGVSMFQVTQSRGARFSCADAFLRPALDRPNLELRTRATVLGVELQGGRAVGVRVRSGRRGSEVLRAEREVVLSAGAIGSPQLLQLSGIGDPD